MLCITKNMVLVLGSCRTDRRASVCSDIGGSIVGGTLDTVVVAESLLDDSCLVSDSAFALRSKRLLFT